MTEPLPIPSNPIEFPVGVDVDQRVGIEALGSCVAAARIAYARLYTNLLADIVGDRQTAQEILVDGWGVIDNVNRMRAIRRAVRGIRNTAATRLFDLSTKDVERFRNFHQHMGREIARAAGYPLLGVLTCVHQDKSDSAPTIKMLLGSTIQQPGGYELSMRPGPVTPPIDKITLGIRDANLDVGDVMKGVNQYAAALDAALRTALSSSIPPDGRLVISP